MAVIIFDFTSFKDISVCKRYEFSDFNTKKRKSYCVGEVREVGIHKHITITVITEEDVSYDCICFYKTIEDIQKMIDRDGHINMHSCYIDNFIISRISNYEDLEIKGIDAMWSFWDNNTSFAGIKSIEDDINFEEATFGDGWVSFREAEFGCKDISFKAANFGEGDVDFTLTKNDNGNISFEKSILGTGIKEFILINSKNTYFNFESTKFNDGDVLFTNSKFGESYNGISFKDSVFGKGEKDFSCVEFDNGEKSFFHVDFGEGKLNFENAKFKSGNVNFTKSIFDNITISFFRATFKLGFISIFDIEINKANLVFAHVDFSLAKLVFKKVNFGENRLNFYGAGVDTIIFRGCEFREVIDFRFEKINDLIIQDCINKKIMLMDKFNNKYIKYKRLSFYDTKNIGEIRIDWKYNKLKKAIRNGSAEILNDSRVIFRNPKFIMHSNEKIIKTFIRRIFWLKEKIKYLWYVFTTPDKISVEKYEQLSMLKENFKKIGYYTSEDECYLEYMKHYTNCPRRYLLKIFWILGGYGTKPLSIIGTMFIIWIIYGAIFFGELSTQFTEPLNRMANALYYSGITFLTIGYGDIVPLCDNARFLSISEGFIGLFLMSYLTIAVVRKLLR